MRKLVTLLTVVLGIGMGSYALADPVRWPFFKNGDWSKKSSARDVSNKTLPKGSLVDVAKGSDNLNILLSAVGAAGLEEALSTQEGLTVFAPTDEAFKKLDASLLEALLRKENLSKLQSILKYHVIPERLSLREAFSKSEVRTLQGSDLEFAFKDGRIKVNDVRVVDTDLDASNGVIHLIDEVLIPPTFRLPESGTAAESAAAGRSSAAPSIAASPGELITLAISRGVPLFNDGQPEACSAVYEVAVQSLLGLSNEALSDTCAKVLRASLNKANGEQDSVEKAWILRRALDYAYASLPELERRTSSMENKNSPPRETSSMLIDDFSESSDISDLGTSWRLVTDRVMGGVSRATSQYDELDGRRCIRLQGDVSLENNGGFVQIALSLRPGDRPFDAQAYRGISLWVRGNGRPYYLHLRTTDNVLPWQYYSAPIETDDTWRRVDIPFSDFNGQSTRMSLDTSKLLRIGVVGAKKAFEADIAIARMELYR